jgi:hypothetical protein
LALIELVASVLGVAVNDVSCDYRSCSSRLGFGGSDDLNNVDHDFDLSYGEADCGHGFMDASYSASADHLASECYAIAFKSCL